MDKLHYNTIAFGWSLRQLERLRGFGKPAYQASQPFSR
jgi:hypothetical protein